MSPADERFRDEGAEKFAACRTRLGHRRDDPGWIAALMILCTPLMANDGRVWRHVDAENGFIDFASALADGTYSHGEYLMVLSAASLFNGSTTVDLQDLACTLSANNLAWVIRAMGCRKGGAAMSYVLAESRGE